MSLMNVDEIAKLIKVQEWNFNNAPTADQLIEALSNFSIVGLVVEPATLFIEFSNQLFTLEEMIVFVNNFQADEIDIIEKNEIRLWWD